MNVKLITLETWAAAMVAQFAREIGLRPGNLWEPTIVKKVTADLNLYPRWRVEREWRIRLGLPTSTQRFDA